MSRGRAEQVRRTTRYGKDEFCYCGVKMGSPGHNAAQCRWWLRHDPSPGRGSPLRTDPPLRLYDAHYTDKEDGGLMYWSRDFEAYLEIHFGRYQAALAQLADRFPDQAWVFIQYMHHDRPLKELAAERGVKVATVWQWKRRALIFMRQRYSTEVSTLSLDKEYEPTKEWSRRTADELKQLNNDPVATLQAEARAAEARMKETAA